MLSGFPFRMVNELQGAYNQFSRLIAGMMQTPHPQAPDLPMAADPRLDLTPYLYRTLEALQKEMSYAGRYRPIDPTDEPAIRGPKQLRGGSTSSSGSGSRSRHRLQVGTLYPQAVPQAAPQGTTSYQSNPSVSVPQSQGQEGNPWESAFNKVVNLLGSPVQSPFQGQPSQAPAPTPGQYSQANWGQQTSIPQSASTSWDQQTSQTSQTSSPTALPKLHRSTPWRTWRICWTGVRKAGWWWRTTGPRLPRF